MSDKDIYKKYLEGESSIPEEEILLNSDQAEPALKPWTDYIKGNRVQAPDGMEDAIWRSIHQKRKEKKRWIYGLSGAAASITIILGFWFSTGSESSEMSISQKEALLNDARAMFQTKENDQKEILYSDELIEIYVATK